jgi:hypothetical protein
MSTRLLSHTSVSAAQWNTVQHSGTRCNTVEDSTVQRMTATRRSTQNTPPPHPQPPEAAAAAAAAAAVTSNQQPATIQTTRPPGYSEHPSQAPSQWCLQSPSHKHLLQRLHHLAHSASCHPVPWTDVYWRRIQADLGRGHPPAPGTSA